MSDRILLSRFGLSWGLGLFLLLLTGCGELYEVDDEEVVLAKLQLSRKTADLMVGDTYALTAALTPDDIDNKALFWQSLNTEVVSVSEGVVKAVGPGEAEVVVTSVSQLVRDTCTVTVHPTWLFTPDAWLHDMVIFANVTVDNRPMDDKIIVGAFDDEGSLRGLGQMEEAAGISYMLLRIYSDTGNSEPITLRCYDRSRACITTCQQTINFLDNGTRGTLSNLYEIKFD